MRRYVLLILFLIVLVAPLIVSRSLGHRAQVRPASDALELVIITAHQEGIRREFADAFSAWHRAKFGQSVNVDYRLYGGGSDMVRYFEDYSRGFYKEHGTYKIDLVWGGGDFLFEEQLKRDRKRDVAGGYLQPVQFDPQFLQAVYPNPTLGGLPLYDQDPKDPNYWFGTALSSFGIVYNKDVVRQLRLPEPKTWKDLANPRYRGWLAMADPTRSASARQTYMVIVERTMADAAAQGRSEDEGWADGMGLIRQISANARLFTDSASVVPIMVSTGDVAAGMAIDFYGRSQADAVGDARMGYVEPANATIINPDPIALVRGAEHREIAVRFIQFVLSEEGQRLWNTRAGLPGGPRQTSLRRLPVRASVYRYLPDFTDQVDPFRTSNAFNKTNAREKTFPILGELMQFSCIDLLDELRQTRNDILSSAGSLPLDAQLGRFPFAQPEALNRMAEWKAALSGQKLELQRRWTNEFAQEYERLRQSARRRSDVPMEP